MVKVKLLCNRTGDDFQQSYGQIVPMSAAEARRHIADGLGELASGQTLPDEDEDDGPEPTEPPSEEPTEPPSDTDPPTGDDKPAARKRRK